MWNFELMKMSNWKLKFTGYKTEPKNCVERLQKKQRKLINVSLFEEQFKVEIFEQVQFLLLWRE